jgi:hypothetical protein
MAGLAALASVPLGHAVAGSRPATAAQVVDASPPMISPGGPVPKVAGLAHTATRSTNWAGYAVSGAPNAFTSAQATFVVPSLTSCAPTESSSSAFWAGLDGFASSTVEQDGVDVSCTDGTVTAFAWYEIYPQSPVTLPHVTVRPGDTVVASATHLTGSSYWLEVSDTTSGTGASVTVALSGAADSSAECIAEDPGSTPVPYAHYGTVSFTGCSVDGSPIGLAGPASITTVDSGGDPVAVPSALTGDSAFSVVRSVPVAVTVSAPSPTSTSPQSSSPAPATTPLPGPVVGMASTPTGSGYWLADAAGGVSAHGSATLYGSMTGAALDSPITHIVASSDGRGYWLVAGDGGVFAFGDAQFYGSMGGRRLNAPVVDMAPTPDDGGYWLVASDGGVFAFGDARFYGSMGGRHLNQPVVAVTGDPDTGGYWLVASDGGVFSFDAPFYGSTGALALNKPIVAMAADASATGYWFVAADGGVFAFGAPFRGSAVGQGIPAPVVGMAPDPATDGYWLVASDGAVASFGAPFYGSD